MNVNIDQLSKSYGTRLRRIQALDQVNLQINSGMFGLLGPNGAGKTTLLRIVATLLKPNSGRVTVDGFDVSDRRQKWVIKQLLGFLPQELGLYNGLSAAEFLDYMATLKNLHNPHVRAEAVAQVMALTGLRTVAHQRIGTLSGGMKRRVGIAQALLGDPQLLIVDEPTAGLDPEERVRFRNLLAGLASDRIVILSTHIVEDIAATCHMLAVLDQGRVRFWGAPAELIVAAKGQAWEVEIPPDQSPPDSWQIVSRAAAVEGLRLRVVGEQPDSSARPVVPTLEEAYLVLMGERPV
jgi:ABC-type multidrug transport system ATPase subunit